MSVKRQGPGVEKLEKTLKSTRKLSTQVGWFPGAKYQNGTPVAYVAAIQEYGSVHIPPRSFMRTTIADKKNEWRKLAKSGSKALIAGNTTARQVMEGLGMTVVGDIKKKITKIKSPALSPATVETKRRKLAKGKKVGSLTKPLIETGLMVSSLTHTVESS